MHAPPPSPLSHVPWYFPLLLGVVLQSSQKCCLLAVVKLTKQKISQSSASTTRWAGEPWGNSGGNKEYLPSSSHQTASTPNRNPGETEAMKTQDAGPRQLRHISGEWFQWAQTISSFHRKVLNSLTWDICFPLIFFFFPATCPLLLKLVCILIAPLFPGSSFLRVAWDVLLWI